MDSRLLIRKQQQCLHIKRSRVTAAGFGYKRQKEQRFGLNIRKQQKIKKTILHRRKTC
jgi:hypothetical protein